MKIYFRQGWTDVQWNLGRITFFQIDWEFGIKMSYFTLDITILNFNIQIDIG